MVEDRAFLKAFFQGVVDRPLEPDDPRYVDLYTGPTSSRPTRSSCSPPPSSSRPARASSSSRHDAAMDTMDSIVGLTRFFDNHVVLCYRDGPEWYDVHPIIREIARKQAAAVEARQKKASAPPTS